MSTTSKRSYADLTHLERVLVAVPKRIHDVDVERNESNSAIIANVEAFDTIKVMGAFRIKTSDDYIVSFDIYSRVMGKMRYSQTIQFTGTKDWAEQWIEMAKADLEG